ncbi:hypothetical protein PR003_g20386 [Phytophthora rubi]|uniref:SWIM-type domain-containing protein n=1 Tax=Phytophthora rubi TaxID=129364 RepID=A0A6A4DK84_9STRA|nr:hypothetical protein PR001_g19751 [Phytophthora rubi]KAE9309933.1 hypothetical protein PR003_g20386 [Phytophthora rubi]
MTKDKLIREVTTMKISIDFLTGTGPQAAATSTLHVVSDQLERVYDAQDRRTKEALPVTACLSAQKARMESASMPGTGWELDITSQKCGCSIFLKVCCCIHLIYGLSVRDQLDLFGRARLVYRGRNIDRREQSAQQVAGRPANNRSALELE